MAAAVQTDEESMVREILASLTLPGGVSLKGIYPDEDSLGMPALRVIFAVSKQIALTQERVKELNRFWDVARNGILDRAGTKWPYVSFVNAE